MSLVFFPNRMIIKLGEMVSIKNYMEMAVKAEVGRRKTERSNSSFCWCSLCEADIISLSLTTLPPRYCMEQSYGHMDNNLLAGTIRAAVVKSIARVNLRPKHRPGLPDFYPHRIRIVNFALEEGSAMVRAVMQTESAPCICYQCVADTLAFALNRFPPLYGIEYDGDTKFPPIQREFFRHDLVLILEKACRTVSLRPHH